MKKLILIILAVLIIGGLTAWLVIKYSVEEIPKPPPFPEEVQ